MRLGVNDSIFTLFLINHGRQGTRLITESLRFYFLLTLETPARGKLEFEEPARVKELGVRRRRGGCLI